MSHTGKVQQHENLNKKKELNVGEFLEKGFKVIRRISPDELLILYKNNKKGKGVYKY